MYKVVNDVNGVLVSAIINNPNIRVTYIQGQPTLPKIPNTGLLAFPHLSDARKFVKCNHPLNLQIWEATGKRCKKPKWRLEVTSFWITRHTITKLWKNLNTRLNGSKGISWPEGSIACSQITLLKRINTGGKPQ